MIEGLSKEIIESTKGVGGVVVEGTKGIGGKILGGIKGFLNNINSFFSNFNLFQATMSPIDNYSTNISSNLLMKQKAEEILNLIRETDISIEDDFFEEEKDPEDLLKKLAEMDKMIKDIQEKTLILIKETEEEIDPLDLEEEQEEEEDDEDEDNNEICSVNINTASKEELEKIIGVGSAIAENIINARPFSSLNDLIRVNRIGEATLAKIIEQNCAFVDSYYYNPTPTGGGGGGGSNIPTPTILITYQENNPVNREILVDTIISNLPSDTYDIKIIIEDNDEKNISNIYNPAEESWNSSTYYINSVFSGAGFTGQFSLKIKDENIDFRGEANITVKVRDSTKKKIIATETERINIVDIEEDEEDIEEVFSYWSNRHQNPHRTGQALVVGPGAVNNPVVEVFLEGNGSNDHFYSSVIDSENNLYLKARIDNKDGIYSFSSGGDLRWYYEGALSSTIDPIITKKGDIFFSIKGKEFPLILYSKEGELIWQSSIGDYYLAGNPVSYNNSIYFLANSFSSGYGKLISLDIDTGEINWEYQIGKILSNTDTLSVGEDETIYFGDRNILYAIDSSGEEKWTKTFEGNYIGISPSVPSVGLPTIKGETIYLIVSMMERRAHWDFFNHCFFKLNANSQGEEILRECSRNFRFNHISVSEDDNIYFGAGYYTGIMWYAGIYSIKGSLTEWIVKDLGDQVEIAVIDKEENIYGIFGSSLLRAYNKEGDMLWQFSLYPSYRVNYLSIDGNGNLYVAGPKKIYIVKKEELIEKPKDNIAPNLLFNLEEIQNNLSFSLFWEGEDLAQEGVEPSGIEGYQLRYSEDNENWDYYPIEESYIEENEYEFTGEDGKTYYFGVRAKDKEGNISEWANASTTIILSTDIEPIEKINLLENWHFEEWEEPGDSAIYLYNWNYSGTPSHILRNEDAFVGDYSLQWIPITSANNLIQNEAEITEEGNYYAEIWIKPINVDSENYIRVSLDIANPIDGSFPSASFTNYTEETEWIKITKEREIEEGENGGIRIRVQRIGLAGPSLLIGATWLGLDEPPLNWPFE